MFCNKDSQCSGQFMQPRKNVLQNFIVIFGAYRAVVVLVPLFKQNETFANIELSAPPHIKGYTNKVYLLIVIVRQIFRQSFWQGHQPSR